MNTAHSLDQREIALVVNAYRAATLDALFATVQGDANFSVRESDRFSDIVEKVIIGENRQASRPTRFTPAGMTTDDTQFLLTGLVCAVVSPEEFSKKLMSIWRNMGDSALWRNSGTRLGAFIAGKPKALSGAVSLGDLLRFSAFSALSDEKHRKSELKLYCEAAQLTAEQQIAGDYFIDAHSQLLMGDIDKAKFLLAKLEQRLPPHQEYIIFFLKAVREELLEKSNFISLLARVSEIGSDFDTFAFLGGLLVPRSALFSTDLPSMLLLPGISVFSVLLTYLFRNNHCLANHEQITGLSRSFYQNEFAVNSYLQKLRSCVNSDELRSLLRSSTR